MTSTATTKEMKVDLQGVQLVWIVLFVSCMVGDAVLLTYCVRCNAVASLRDVHR